MCLWMMSKNILITKDAEFERIYFVEINYRIWKFTI